MTCNKMVQSGGSRVGYRCGLQAGHAGPCATHEVPKSMTLRASWEAGERVLETQKEGVAQPMNPPAPPPVVEPEVAKAMVSALRQRPGDQPLPKATDGPIMHELVIEDLRKRLELGISRYGQPLQALNGRNSAQDAYDEILDLSVYARQWLVEREALIRVVQRLLAAQSPSDQWKAADEAMALLRSLGAQDDG